MNQDKKITDEVNKTISLLNKIKTIESNPFLFTRIKEEISSGNIKNTVPVSEFAFNIFKKIILALLFVFNIYSVISYLSNSKLNEQYRRQYIKNVLSEYSIKTENDYLTNFEIKD